MWLFYVAQKGKWLNKFLVCRVVLVFVLSLHVLLSLYWTDGDALETNEEVRQAQGSVTFLISTSKSIQIRYRTPMLQGRQTTALLIYVYHILLNNKLLTTQLGSHTHMSLTKTINKWQGWCEKGGKAESSKYLSSLFHVAFFMLTALVLCSHCCRPI